MNEIWVAAALILILAIFIALMLFYGLVVWHWWNNAKGRSSRMSK
jgi:Flp pilus assembly protein TadB